MKSLIALICFILANVATAQSTCIPRVFAEDDAVANYAKISEEKQAELAKVQKDYAELTDQVQRKKSTDSKIELMNAFVDGAAMVWLIHYSVGMAQMPLVTFASEEELIKKFGENYKEKTAKLVARAQRIGYITGGEDGNLVTRFLKAKSAQLKDWFKALKDMSFTKQAGEVIAASASKVGVVSTLLALPLGIYVAILKIKEQQRLVQLTAEQDKLMKQALLLELFLNQKSFAELAATRAKLQPNRVCPPAS